MTGIPLFELAPVFSALGLESCSRLTLVDAAELSKGHVPRFPPDAGVLVTGFDNGEMAGRVKRSLSSVYPLYHVVKFIRSEKEIVEIRLQLDPCLGHLGLR